MLTILRATETDLEAIQNLAYEIWPVYYQHIISLDQVEYMLRLFGNPAHLSQEMAAGLALYVVREGKTPIGYMALKPHANTRLKIDKLYLLPETRGKNYGRELLQFAEKEAQKQKCTNLILNVNRFNPSFQFYLKNGFHIAEQVDIPLGPYWLFDFVMEKGV